MLLQQNTHTHQGSTTRPGPRINNKILLLQQSTHIHIREVQPLRGSPKLVRGTRKFAGTTALQFRVPGKIINLVRVICSVFWK